MKRRTLLIAGFAALCSLILLAWLSDLRINRSESLPGLLWKMETLDDTALLDIQRGQPVFICPPDTAIFQLAKTRGYVPFGLSCPNYYAPLLKPIAAIAGDQIRITPEGIRINGELQANSKLLTQDGHGRSMPLLTKTVYTLAPGQFWVLSDYHPRSFDSRYFGPIAQQHIIGRASVVTAFSGW